MNFLDFKDIAERDMELINPVSAEKVVEIGRLAGLAPGKQVIDFGCGYAEALVLWAERFGSGGVGIDLRPRAVQRARDKISAHNLEKRIEIFEGKGADYQYPPHSFHLAACIGASFVWGDYRQALQALKGAILPEGRIVIGEPYWLKDNIPPEFAQSYLMIHSEVKLLEITRQCGLEVAYVLRASLQDWDRYEAGNWLGLLRWIDENPEHAERQQVIDHLHESQEEYFRYGREYFGWAMYLLQPGQY